MATKTKTGLEEFNSFNFDQPRHIGASEYAVLYELLQDCFDTDGEPMGEWIADEPIDYALAILDQVDMWSRAMREKVEASRGN